MTASLFADGGDYSGASEGSWLDSSAVTTLDIDIQVTALTHSGDTAANSMPNVSFYLEGETPSGVIELWQGVFYELGEEHGSIGPGLEIDRVVPDHVRLRWDCGTSIATIVGSIEGK